MKTKQHLLSIAACVLFALLFIASATQNRVPQTPVKVATYDYTPPTTLLSKSSKVALLLLHPQYARNFKYSGIDVFSTFSKSMVADFNELLIAKGYSVRGPYEIYDAVVYSDKKETDLMLEVEIDLNVNTTNALWTSELMYGYPQSRYVYKLNGNIVLSGKVNLTASEPLTREKLWAKSIPLAQQDIGVASEATYDLPNNWELAFRKDPGIINPITNVLEGMYKSVFATAWGNLDPNELEPLKKQVDEIREKKKY